MQCGIHPVLQCGVLGLNPKTPAAFKPAPSTCHTQPKAFRASQARGAMEKAQMEP